MPVFPLITISGPIEALRQCDCQTGISGFPLITISGPIEASKTTSPMGLWLSFPLITISGPIEAAHCAIPPAGEGGLSADHDQRPH